MRKDLNGRLPEIGDVIYRYNTWKASIYEIVSGFTASGNPKLIWFSLESDLVKFPDGYHTYKTGYIVGNNFVILDTPRVNDDILEAINKERKKMGLKPLKNKYGDS